MSVVNEERCYTVYIHINKINNKTYVGITGIEPEKRWRRGFGYYHNKYFYRAIQKYNWDKDFEHIILFENKTKEEAEQLEVLYIKILLSNNKYYGYNISNGGESIGKHSEESKLKMSEARKLVGKKRGSHPSAQRVYCNNKIFECIKDCADYYNINHTVVRSWLQGKVCMPQEFKDLGLQYADKETILKEDNNIRIVCDNQIFNTIKECADYYDVNSSNMCNWLLGKRKMPKKFIDLELQYLNRETNSYEPKLKKVVCDGKIFDNITECALYYDLKPSTMGKWLNKINGMPQKYIKLGLHYLNDNTVYYSQTIPKSRKIICGNQIFDTIRSCSKYYDENYTTFYNWLTNKNKTPQKYIDLGLRYYNPEVDGDIEQYEQYIETKSNVN